jgi:hypothetical protein
MNAKPTSMADSESRPKRVLEQIKGVSEQKATKILQEGMSRLCKGTEYTDLNF